MYIIINEEARALITTTFDDFNVFVNALFYETNDIYCVVLYKEKIPVSFALLHKMDFDPIKVHTKPVLLDFIYTFETHRRNGYAAKLIKALKKSNQMTGFCNTDDSVRLFTRCGFSLNGDCCRYPMEMKYSERT